MFFGIDESNNSKSHNIILNYWKLFCNTLGSYQFLAFEWNCQQKYISSHDLCNTWLDEHLQLLLS